MRVDRGQMCRRLNHHKIKRLDVLQFFGRRGVLQVEVPAYERVWGVHTKYQFQEIFDAIINADFRL